LPRACGVQNIEWNIHRWCGYYGRGI